MRKTVPLLLLLGALSVASAQDAPPEKKGEGETAPPKPVHVLVLGKEQLVTDAAGFPAFCAKNEKTKRSELRASVVAKLKKLADDARPGLLKALGGKEVGWKGEARPLWLVNAVAVELTPAQIEAAKALDVVRWVYPAGRIPVAGDAGKLTEVLRREDRKPFSVKGKDVAWNVKGLGAPDAWKQGVTGKGVVIGSFDNGANYRHPDLRGAIWINPDEKPDNGKDDDGNGLVDDVYGYDFTRMKCDVIATDKRQHGSLTSCVAVGDGTDGVVTGVAPDAELMLLRASGGPYLAARAFQYALDEGADIVSMSFSIPNLGQTRGLYRQMAEHATCAGMVLISGAGNFRKQVKVPVQIRIPEGIPCVICVGGVTAGERPSEVSSMGPVVWGDVKFYEDHPAPEGLLKPDVSAFIGPRLGLIHTNGEGYLPEGNRRRGNSLSAPQVAGVCALMLSADPELTPWRVKAILEETAKDLKPAGRDPETGMGLVRALPAVKAALGK